MLKPKDRAAEQKLKYFDPDRVLSIRLLANRYDKVYKFDEKLKAMKQAMVDLDVAYDGEVFESLCSTFMWIPGDYGPNNACNLLDPDWSDIDRFRKYLTKTYTDSPDKKFLNIWLFAAHGMVEAGQQTVLINEYFPREKYYRRYKAEYFVRLYARKYVNTHHLCIFACCRQIYNPSKDTNCFKGPLENAQAEYAAELAAKKAGEEEQMLQQDKIADYDRLKKENE